MSARSSKSGGRSSRPAQAGGFAAALRPILEALWGVAQRLIGLDSSQVSAVNVAPMEAQGQAAEPSAPNQRHTQAPGGIQDQQPRRPDAGDDRGQEGSLSAGLQTPAAVEPAAPEDPSAPAAEAPRQDAGEPGRPRSSAGRNGPEESVLLLVRRILELQTRACGDQREVLEMVRGIAERLEQSARQVIPGVVGP
jgi:hypothetical protein